MTGRSIARTGVTWGASLRRSFRTICRTGNCTQWQTLPQHFRAHGWVSVGAGKTFHNNGNFDDSPWSYSPEVPYFPFAFYTTLEFGDQSCPGATLNKGS